MEKMAKLSFEVLDSLGNLNGYNKGWTIN